MKTDKKTDKVKKLNRYSLNENPINEYLLRAKSFRTKKRLGQNFLVDENALDTILEEVNPEDTVLEIGAGAGFVTERLVDSAKKVYAVEIDEDAIKELKKINADNLTLLHSDILKTELKDVEDTTFKIIANIPYYITSPIIAHLLGEIDDLNNENRYRISEIVLMVQYEVAQRLVATEKSPSKQFGLLSILTQFNAEVEILQKVPSRSFYPSPKVDSALVKLKIRKEPLIKFENPEDYTFFRRTVKACFATRRKNIKNSLQNAGFTKEAVSSVLSSLNITENTRGEALSINMLAQLALGLKIFEKDITSRTLESTTDSEN